MSAVLEQRWPSWIFKVIHISAIFRAKGYHLVPKGHHPVAKGHHPLAKGHHLVAKGHQPSAGARSWAPIGG